MNSEMVEISDVSTLWLPLLVILFLSESLEVRNRHSHIKGLHKSLTPPKMFWNSSTNLTLTSLSERQLWNLEHLKLNYNISISSILTQGVRNVSNQIYRSPNLNNFTIRKHVVYGGGRL